MACTHKQCDLCFTRECRDAVIKRFGQILACERCVNKAVQHTYDAVCRFGGPPPEDVCGHMKEHANANQD